MADDFEELLRIQRMMASRIADESETDSKIKLLDILRDMKSGKRGVPKEQVFVEARLQGMMDTEVMRVLDSLKQDGLLAEKDGYVQLT
jgi:hypothetical protein